MTVQFEMRPLGRAAVAVHHPDKGGSADAFRVITSARDVLVDAIWAGAR